MVTFDLNLTVGNWPFRPLPYSAMGQLAAHLKPLGITGGLVRAAEAPFCADLEWVNRLLARRVAGHPGFLALPAVHPAYLRTWKDFHGPAAALYPTYHGYALDAPETLEMARTLASAGALLVLVLREEDERNQNPRCAIKPLPPATVEAFAQALPEARILALNAYAGEVSNWNAPNLFSDIAYVEAGLTAFASFSGALRAQLVFGSHTPFLATCAALSKVAECPIAQAQAICHQNQARIEL